MDYFIEATCANGHSQVLQVSADLGGDYAFVLAGLLDGTSELYRFPPGPESVISKCGICGATVACEVSEARPDAKEE